VEGVPTEVMKTKEYRNMLNQHQADSLDAETTIAAAFVRTDKDATIQPSTSEAFQLREEEDENRPDWSMM